MLLLLLFFIVCGGGVIMNMIDLNNPYNSSACIDYTVTHSFMCGVVYSDLFGSLPISGLIDGIYEAMVKSFIIFSAFNNSITLNYLYEGPTNIMYIVLPQTLNGSYTFPSPVGYCYCSTNNCDSKFDACTSGLNYSSALLVVNTNTSLASTTPTTSVNRITNNSTFQQSNTTISTILLTTMNRTNTTNISVTMTLSTTSMWYYSSWSNIIIQRIHVKDRVIVWLSTFRWYSHIFV